MSVMQTSEVGTILGSLNLGFAGIFCDDGGSL
jgi:hypothetical protein